MGAAVLFIDLLHPVYQAELRLQMALLRNFGGLVFRLDRNGPVVSDIEPYIAGLFRVHFLERLVCLIPLEGLHDRNAVLEVLVERYRQGRAAVADPV